MNKKGWWKWYVILGIAVLFVIIFFLIIIVKNINCGATDNFPEFNDKIKDDIRLLFVNEGVRVVAPESRTSFPGQEKGIVFGVKNIFNKTKSFEYKVKPIDLESCRINESDAEREIIFGTGYMAIPRGSIEYNRILFLISENRELCQIKYRIDVFNEHETYGSVDFEIKVVSKTQYTISQIGEKEQKSSPLSFIKKIWTC